MQSVGAREGDVEQRRGERRQRATQVCSRITDPARRVVAGSQRALRAALFGWRPRAARGAGAEAERRWYSVR